MLPIILILLPLILFIYFYYRNKQNNEDFTVIQTYKTETEHDDKTFSKGVNSWKAFNDYVYFNDRQCITFLRNYFNEEMANIFNSIKLGAYKADFFRYCWIYIMGGIYADFDTQCLTNINYFIQRYEPDMILTKDVSPFGFYQAFIYCKYPGNILIKKCIDACVKNVYDYRKGKKFGHLQFTGPQLVYEEFVKLEPSYQCKEPPEGIIYTSLGKLLILSWLDPNTIGFNGEKVFLHKAEGYVHDFDHYYANNLHKVWTV